MQWKVVGHIFPVLTVDFQQNDRRMYEENEPYTLAF